MDELTKRASDSAIRFAELSQTIKDAEKRMAEIAVLKTHIINYSKTKDVYVAYRKAGYSKQFFEAHREEILLHKAAKEAFGQLEPRFLCSNVAQQCVAPIRIIGSGVLGRTP